MPVLVVTVVVVVLMVVAVLVTVVVVVSIMADVGINNCCGGRDDCGCGSNLLEYCGCSCLVILVDRRCLVVVSYIIIYGTAYVCWLIVKLMCLLPWWW